MDAQVAVEPSTSSVCPITKRIKLATKVTSSIQLVNRVPEVHIENGNSRSRRGKRLPEPNEPRNPMDSNAEDEIKEELKNGASHVIQLLSPVSLCMLVVITSIRSTNYYTRTKIYLVYTPFHEDTNDTGTKAWQAVANSLILIAVVVFMTVVMVVLYIKRFYKIIHGWLIVSSFSLLFLFSSLHCEELLKAYNLPLDVITLGIGLWNFGVIGMVCIHWHGPLPLQQAYLIFISSLMALVFIKYLPEWTAWTTLAVISIWDLIAVLTPKGPLRILVETAQKRNEMIIPALIYSSTVMYAFTMTDSGFAAVDTKAGNDGNTEESILSPTIIEPQNQSNSVTSNVDHGDRHARQEREMGENAEGALQETMQIDLAQRMTDQRIMITEEERGVKLGLGDFIFYSILVGKASTYGDWNTTLSAFLAILIGLCLTISLFAIFRKALPALPISIAFGLIFYFATRIIISPFADTLAREQIFI